VVSFSVEGHVTGNAAEGTFTQTRTATGGTVSNVAVRPQQQQQASQPASQELCGVACLVAVSVAAVALIVAAVGVTAACLMRQRATEAAEAAPVEAADGTKRKYIVVDAVVAEE